MSIAYRTDKGLLTLTLGLSTSTENDPIISEYGTALLITKDGRITGGVLRPGDVITMIPSGDYFKWPIENSDNFKLDFYKKDGTFLGKTSTYSFSTFEKTIYLYGGPDTDPHTYGIYYENAIKRVDMYSSMAGFFINQEEAETFPGEISGAGGGTGIFDKTSDDIDFQNLPTLSATDTGFITLYNPSVLELRELATFMWTTDFINNIKKLFGNPMDAILGLSIVPLQMPISGRRSVKVGFVDTGVEMNVVSGQYISMDCGALTINEYWGSALDYLPYTKIQIYLPYIGVRDISTDEIMGKTVHVVYNIDILSGSIAAQIKCGNSVLYTFSGSCSSSIPVTGQNFTQVISSALNIASSMGLMAASGGLSAPVSASMAVSGVMTTANNVIGAKPRIEHSGSIAGTSGLMSIQTPYLIIEIPRQSLADKYNSFVGYPSNVTKLLGDLNGYTEIDSIHFENVNATENELNEIERLLKMGVIL